MNGTPPTPSPTQAPEVTLPAFPDRADIVFHGHPQQGGPALITVETPTGETLGVLPHVRHTPDGFQWGYAGPGPAETARCLLLAAVTDPRCQTCHGTRRIVVDPDTSRRERAFNPATDADSSLVLDCGDCEDSVAELPYQDFKFHVVAQWPSDEEWRFSRGEILAWLEQHRTARR